MQNPALKTCSWAGKASFCLGDVKRGKAEYKLAIVQDSSSLAAWEGLAELQMANGEVGEAQQTFEQLVCLAAPLFAIDKLVVVTSAPDASTEVPTIAMTTSQEQGCFV